MQILFKYIQPNRFSSKSDMINNVFEVYIQIYIMNWSDHHLRFK